MHGAKQQKESFLEELWAYYGKHARHDLPWRISEANRTFDPYKILVSEIMLQQTQVQRVTTKYNEFLATFPTVEALAEAQLGDVLRMWQGLGYNRRAKYLWEAAKRIADLGKFPSEYHGLVALPGIGPNTAGAILAYAYNQPALFIETNVRTVYIHAFFNDENEVTDKAILEVLKETIDQEQPREFYWALMDYGSYLKKHVRNNSQSKHYTKQSKFEGSNRQIRGMVLRELAEGKKSMALLTKQIDDKRLTTIIETLEQEEMITRSGETISLR